MDKYDYIKTGLFFILLLYSCVFHGQSKTPKADTLRIIHLQEVTVTATQPNAPGTSSVIGQEAIKHIQATDLSDFSQLLPGVLTRNPNLNAPSVFTIRSATFNNATNASGTAILVDGMRLSNNANLQLTGIGADGAMFNSSALSGTDIRSLSPASIESVEVIRGIPSARYGDATSGMVLVKSKAGIQPASASLRLTATEKLAAFSKGWQLGAHRGILFLGADYAFSAQDARLPEQAFHRFGVQAAYNKDFTNVTLRLNVRGHLTKDNDKQGANAIDGEFRKTLNQGFSLSASGEWKANKPWINRLEYHAGVTYAHQRNETNTPYTGIQQTTTYTREPGEHEGIFLPPSYFSPLSVDGKPFTANGSLVAHLQHTLYNKVYNHFLFGLEANAEGNYGQGIQFDPLRPPLEMLNLRIRSYRDIPSIYHYTAFAEDNFSLHTGSMRTEVQAGIRFTRLQAKGIHRTTSADPRLNLRQVFIEKDEDHLFSHLSLRAGWGLLHKMPVLAYLFPDRAYTDKNCFTYNDAENSHRLTVMHTFITDRTLNPQLKLPVNRKFELGINFRIGNITADVVWFNEHLRNGYCATQQAEPFTYRRYDPLLSEGEQPILTADGIINKGTPLPFTTHTTFATYTRPQNGIEQKKQGVEYTIDLGHCNLLHTSFLINGGYLKLSEKNTALSAYYPQTEVNGKPYPYVGIYEWSGFPSNLRVWQQFNTRFQCITQLPRIGLITSLTLQAVWIDKHRRGMASIYPVHYLDREGNQHPFTQEMETDPQFAELIMRTNSLTAFETDSFSPYFLLNLRVTKKIGRSVSIAFCANNVTASNPKRFTRSTQQYTILNPDLYYGAEINIQF